MLSVSQKQPPEVLYKKDVLKNFAVFTEKHLYMSLFLIKLKAFSTAALSKWDSNTSVFLWILRNFEEHLFWETTVNGYFFSVYCDYALNHFMPLVSFGNHWKS